jgi:DNA-binding CsgD family transcriptional regulator
MIAIQQGNFEYGERQLLSGLEMAKDSGTSSWIGQANFSMGVVKQDRGHPLEAIPFFEAAQRTFVATDQLVFANIALNNLGLVTARVKDPQAGLAIIEQSRRNHQELRFPFGAALADRYAGQILVELGDTEQARAALRSSLQLEPENMQGWHVANAIETIAQLDAREGCYRHAAVLGAGAVRLREEIGVPLEPALAGVWAAFESLVDEHLSDLELEAATAEGRALPLSELIELAKSDTNPPPVAAVPAPHFSTSREIAPELPRLTPREYEVLVLLVDGRTNGEIADALYISPRTVSVHVTHILEKLEVENRSAAVALALRTGAVLPPEPIGA